MMVNKMTLNLRKMGSTDREEDTQLPTLKFGTGETHVSDLESELTRI